MTDKPRPESPELEESAVSAPEQLLHEEILPLAERSHVEVGLLPVEHLGSTEAELEAARQRLAEVGERPGEVESQKPIESLEESRVRELLRGREFKRINREDVQTFLREMPLRDLGPELAILATRIYAHRQEHKGLVPEQIFEACVGLSGVSVSVQLVNEVVDESGQRLGFALQGRTTEQGTIYRNTCCTLRMTDTIGTALDRNTNETFGYLPSGDVQEFLGVTLRDNPKRQSSCLTLMYRRIVRPETVAGFVGTWRVFSEEEIVSRRPEINVNNQEALAWVAADDREQVIDLRGGYMRKTR